MKSIKFLAALAIPAMFAACTNEEIVVESPKQQLTQVVGAELIGTGISMEVSNGASSRLNATGWQDTDKLGLGWIVSGKYNDGQVVNSFPTSNEWFANHMFYVEDGKFITRGNVYKGWHFAYFPFNYIGEIDEQTWTVNPPQTSKEWAGGRVNDALCISPLKFLSSESLDPETYQLKPEVEFSVQRAVNSIHVNTTAADQFAANGSLADLDVKSITLSMAGGINYPFCHSMKMNVINLPKEVDEKISTEDLVASFYAATNPVFVKTAVNTITTDVAGAGFKVSEATELITLTAPYAGGDLDVTKLSMDIVAGSGTFKITYHPDAEEGTNDYINNQALEALKNALAKGKELTQVNQKVYLDVVLCAKDFKTDFLHISDLTEWKEAVDMVTKLGRETEVFGIDGVIEFSEGKIPMPENCTITVNPSEGAAETGLKITKNIASWPAGLTSTVKVINEKTINNATGINGRQIENKGTLKGITGEITSKVVNNEGIITLTKTGALADVNNEGGRINVVYGSKVTTTGTNKGIIAYTIGIKEYAYKLNNLIATSSQNFFANVNTFVINSGKTLNLGLTDSGRADSDDPYNPTGGTDDVKLESLANINIELNGGEIVGIETNNAVYNVIMDGGIVNGVNINGTLTAVSGTVTSNTIKGAVVAENTVITAETIENNVTLKGENTINGATITGNVTVEGTATLNDVQIDGTLTIKNGASVVLNSLNTIEIGNIVNSGELVANNNIVTESVTLNPQSTTTLTDKPIANKDWNKTIYYETSYTHDKMTLNGTVMKNGEGEVDAEGKTVALSQAGLENALKATGVTEIKLAEGEYTFPSNNVPGNITIICEEGTTFTGNSKLNINGATVVGATFSNPSGTAVDQTINGTFKNCTFTGSNGARWCYAGETVVFEDCVFDGSVYGVHFDGGANDIIFRNCTLSGFNALGSAVTMVTFEGCTFKGNGKSGYNGANLWGSAKLIGCEFTFDGSTANEWIDCIGADKTYEFTNCTVNGVAYTSDNYKNYEELIFSRNNTSVKINDVDCQM